MEEATAGQPSQKCFGLGTTEQICSLGDHGAVGSDQEDRHHACPGKIWFPGARDSC